MELWVHVDFKYMPPTVESLQKDIKGWAAEGATGIVFEWENMFPYPGLEDAVRKDAYSARQINEILDTCRSNGLKPIPLMQTLGHLEWLLKQQPYHSLCELPDKSKSQIKACHDPSIALLRKKIDALVEAHYDSPYIHLGGDEASLLGVIDRPDCSSIREGACTVFLRHMKRLIEPVLSHGKRPIIWSDMPLRYPERIDDFPDSLIFCDWLYHEVNLKPAREYDYSGFDWQCHIINADNYDKVPEQRRRLFEKYWKLDLPEFSRQFYQFPYTPFLRDHGYDVVGGATTLYAGNSMAATNLPQARANGREWLRAARRFGAIGVLNTCWSLRGALRESTKVGHRAFLLHGNQIDALPTDKDISWTCWQAIAGDQASVIASLIDSLNPPVDDLAYTKPLYFDTKNRTLRPRAYDSRFASLHDASIGPEEIDSTEIETYQATVERGWETAKILAEQKTEHEEIQAWELGAREMAIRAEAWLLIKSRLHHLQLPISLDKLRHHITQQATMVEAFMQDRYMELDVNLVRQDRYESLQRLLSKVSSVCPH